MDETAIIVAVIVVAAVVVVAAVAWWFTRRRSRGLHERFGPEYDRALEHGDSRGDAGGDPRERERRRDELELAPLDDEARARYAEEWLGVQQRFVDAPAQSLAEADVL